MSLPSGMPRASTPPCFASACTSFSRLSSGLCAQGLIQAVSGLTVKSTCALKIICTIRSCCSSRRCASNFCSCDTLVCISRLLNDGPLGFTQLCCKRLLVITSTASAMIKPGFPSLLNNIDGLLSAPSVDWGGYGAELRSKAASHSDAAIAKALIP